MRLLILLLPLVFASLPAVAQRTVLLAPESFGAALAGWTRQGPADFALDAAQAHDGKTAARIVVQPGAPLEYQQLNRGVEASEGDEITASVWVRAEGVNDGTGAYMALEFTDAAKARVGIVHSELGLHIGRGGWQRLTAEGVVPAGSANASIHLVLNSHATAWFAAPELVRTGRREPWPDLGSATRHVVVRTDRVVQPNFGGVGFHAFHHIFSWSEDDLNQVIYKRWRELNPSFVRINHEMGWDRTKLDQVAEHLRVMKETGTTVYVTTWDPPDVKDDAELAAYVRKVADTLEYWIRDKGLTNIRYYCMTNELSLKGWGKLMGDLPRFKQYHEALYAEFQRRKLPVGLLATDASPVGVWSTVEWAAQNMDPITAVYGGHHYINDSNPGDERFYPWWLGKLQHIVGVARSKGKEFILGEFGSKQDGRTVDGVKLDVCVWFGTPEEPMVGIQVPEAAIAAIDAGVWAMGYWTFMDLPDEYAKGYLNKWGLFKCTGPDRSTRSLYYAYGLLTRFFRGPAKVYEVTSDDPRLRVAALSHPDGSWSIAVVNRGRRPAPLRVSLSGGGAAAPRVPFRRYVYDPQHVPQNPFGDMQPPTGKLTLKDGRLEDTVGPDTLTVYTTDYDDRPPAAVQGLTAARLSGGKTRLTWQPNRERDLCYYRVFRDGRQVASTIAVSFTDATPGKRYSVVAVDHSGNAGKAAEAGATQSR